MIQIALPERSMIEQTVEFLIREIDRFVGTSLRPYQLTITRKLIRSILLNEGREFTLLWCRQIGKTEMGQRVISGLMVLLPRLAAEPGYARQFPILHEYRGGFHVGFVAPKMGTARIPFRRLRRSIHSHRQQAYLESLGVQIITSSSEELSLSNGSTAIALSGAPTAFQEGHTLHLVWFEETQEIAQYQIRKVFEPMIAATNGTMVKVGTAGWRRCSFLDSIEANKQLGTGDHNEITWRQVIEIMRSEAPGDPWTDRYERFVQKQIERLPAGELSESFRMNFDLEWILKSSQLISFELWRRLCADGVDGRPLIHRADFTEGKRRIFGLDWGKVNDATVVTAGEQWDDHVRWLDWLEIQGTAYDEQIELIIPWCLERGGGTITPAPAFVLDSTGVGDPLTDFMRKLVRGVVGLTYTAQNKDTLYKLWQRRLPGDRRGAQILYPVCDSLDVEFKRFELQFLNCEVETKGNLIAYHHREDVDEELGTEVQHDDYVDSAFNTLHAAGLVPAIFSSITAGRQPGGTGSAGQIADVEPKRPDDLEILAAVRSQLMGVR